MGLWKDSVILSDGYVARPVPTRLAAIFRYVLPLGKALPLILYIRITVDRAPVRIGIRGGIVTIEHARAGIVTIVSVAQANSTTNRVDEGSTYFFIKSDAKIHTFIVIQQVKERYLTLFVREGLARRRGRPPDGGGVLCTLRVPTYHAPTVSFVLNGAANSQRTAPPPASALEGAWLP